MTKRFVLRRTILAATAVIAFALSAPRATAGFYDLYVSQLDGRGTGQVLRFDPTGQATVFAAGLNSPTGLAFDAQGNLLVSDTSASVIRKFSSTGASLGVFASANLPQPYGLAVDGAGSLFAVSNDNIVRLNAATGAEIGRFAAGSNPTQVAVTAAGLIDVVNLNGGEVRQFTATGADRGALISGLAAPFGLAIGAAGDLYVSELFNNDIRHFSSTGQDLGVFANSGLINPAGLAFDPDGNLYVVNNNNGSNGYVRKYSSTGDDLGIVASGISGATFLAIRPTTVPEPASLALVALGLIPLAIRQARHARR